MNEKYRIFISYQKEKKRKKLTRHPNIFQINFLIETDQDWQIINRERPAAGSNNLFTRFAQISDISLLRELVRPYSMRQLRHNAFILYRVERQTRVHTRVPVCSTRSFRHLNGSHLCRFRSNTFARICLCHRFRSRLSLLPPLSKALRVLQL